jgi:hypothetical protein
MRFGDKNVYRLVLLWWQKQWCGGVVVGEGRRSASVQTEFPALRWLSVSWLNRCDVDVLRYSRMQRLN